MDGPTSVVRGGGALADRRPWYGGCKQGAAGASLARGAEMRVRIVNRSRLADAEVAAGARAVADQVKEDVAPWWHVALEIAGPRARSWDGELEVFDAPLPGATANTSGDHTVVGGVPWSWIAVDTATVDHPWTVMLSHELLEMLVNPRIYRFAPRPPLKGPDRGNVAEEICDPVWATSYLRGDVKVSAFVLPAWFDLYAPEDAPTWFDGAPRRDLAPGEPRRPGGVVLVQTTRTDVVFDPPDLGRSDPPSMMAGSGRHLGWAASKA